MAEKNRFQPFYEKGAAHIAAMAASGQKTFPTIKPGQPAWQAWETYFLAVYGSLPAVMGQVRAGVVPSMTVPTEDPQEFDLSYQPPAYLRRKDDSLPIGPQERARVAAAMDALGDELSMGKPDAERRRAERNFRGRETREKPKAPSVSLDDIRSRYADLTAADWEASPDLVEHLGRQRRDVA